MKQNLTFNNICRIVIFFFFISKTNGSTINVVNQCGFTVWPGIYSSPVIDITGFELTEGSSQSFQTPTSWSGILWGRTGCTFNGTGHGSCKTGECGSGEMECNGRSPTPPVTLAGFDFNVRYEDSYNVSVIHGYNLQMTVEPTISDCLKTGCVYDLNKRCPEELRVEGGGGCNTTCQYCCDIYGASSTCKPTPYSPVFNLACPGSYYSRKNDGNWISPHPEICPNGNYTVRFCPPDDDYSTIKVGNHLNYDEQLVSTTGNFTLGFFNNDYYRWYLGIWYASDVEGRKVWVANPNNPILPSTKETLALSIDLNSGDVIITYDGGAAPMKITNVQAGTNPNVTATLEDNGNFRLVNEIDKRVLWQSFDHPTNVLLPVMKLGYNIITGQNWTLTSWLTDDVFDSGSLFELGSY